MAPTELRPGTTPAAHHANGAPGEGDDPTPVGPAEPGAGARPTALPPTAAERAPSARRDHGFHPLRVVRVVHETADARTFVLDVPDRLRDAFAYEPGQFCNVRVPVGERPQVRCYSMSSCPSLDEGLHLTVKRVPDGVVSSWLVDRLGAGDELEVGLPTGFFRLTPATGDLVAFAAGSGITPIFSLAKAVLATTGRRVRLLYANRDRDSVIFDAELRALAERHGDRLLVRHHLDTEDGLVGPDDVTAFAGTPCEGSGPGDGSGPGADPAEFYLCGPGPFMAVVEDALREAGVDRSRIHVERFTPAEPVPEAPPPAAATEAPTRVVVELDGRTGETEHRPGTTILQTARQLGLSPPFSCESGSCATCMARLVEGTATMRENNALTDDEVADGWILTCQAVPTGPSVRVVYGYDD